MRERQLRQAILELRQRPDFYEQLRESLLLRRWNLRDQRQRPDFYEQLRDRMWEVYATVLPGLAPNSDARSGTTPSYFVIGPEKQMQSWEGYLQNVEPGSRLARIYPHFGQAREVREG